MNTNIAKSTLRVYTSGSTFAWVSYEKSSGQMQLCYKKGGYANQVKTHEGVSVETFLKVLKVTKIKPAAFELIKAQLLGEYQEQFVPKNSVIANETEQEVLLNKAG